MKCPAFLVAALLAGVVPVTSAPPDLIEVGRTGFDIPFNPDAGSSIALAPHAPVLYVLSGSDLFVIDPEGGAVADVIDLSPLQIQSDLDFWRLVVSQQDGEYLLLLWNARESDVQVFSLTDPWRPERRNVIRTVQYEVGRVLPLPGIPLVFVLDYWGDLYRLDGQRLPRPPLPGRPERHYATAIDDAGRSILAAFNEERLYPQPDRHWITTVDVADRTVRSNIEITTDEYVEGLWLSPDAGLMVIAYRDYPTNTARFETRDPATGAMLGSFFPPGNGLTAVLAAGGSVLVVADPDGLDLVDLTDPAAPTVLGRVDANLGVARFGRFFSTEMAVSPDDRVVFVPAKLDRELLAIDVESASVVGRWATGGAVPERVVVGRDPAGVVRAAVISRKWDPYEGYGTVLERGGEWRLDVVDVTVPASPVEIGRVDRVVPDRIEGFASVGGRFGVVDDPEHNVLVLFALHSGEILDTGGFFLWYDRNFPDWPYEQRIQTAGDWILGMSSRWYERIEVRGGRLVPHSAAVLDGTWLSYGLIRTDGTVVLQVYEDGRYKLRTVHLDGRTGTLDLPFEPDRMTLSPSGKRLLLEKPGFFGEGTGAVVDLSDPLSPRLLWDGIGELASAQFLPGEDRLLVSTDYFGSHFSVRVHDTDTGQPLGSPSEPLDKFAYHDRGTAFGSPPDTRAVFWKWTYLGWETAVFDVDSDPPRVVAVLPEFGGFPEYLPRDADRGWTEFHRNPWGGTSRIYLGEPDASQHLVLARVADWEQPRAVRHGFFAAQEQSDEKREIVLWRDIALNREPVAHAGDDRVLECGSPAGTPALLDGSSSSDPDSTPGTHDDVARFAWTLDEALVGTTEVVSVDLTVGEHRAELTVEDVLGAVGADDVGVRVQDTTPPRISLDLQPVVSGPLFAHEWLTIAQVDDRCDGALSPALWLRLLESAATLPTRFRSSTVPAVEVRGTNTPTKVVLEGPDEAVMRALWDRARNGGGFEVGDETPTVLILDETSNPGGRVPFVRYELDAAGRVERALAFGAGTDLVIEATASDAAGNQGAALASLRDTIARLCAALPGSATCR